MNGLVEKTVMQAPTGEPGSTTGSYSHSVLKILRRIWSATHFEDQSVTHYARHLMLAETRKGIILMAVVSLLVQLTAIALYQKLGVNISSLYIYSLLGLLSLHVIISARFVSDLAALNLLGMVLLIFTSVAIMSIAHRTGSMSAGPMASIVLLFMVMPIMPWGLREASIVVGLSYLTITFSFLSVEGRFDQDTLWTAQFLILASATTAVLTMVRNTLLRKDEIRSKFDLEKAHRRLESMSMRDPLTGAWNRRFLEQKFDAYAECSFDAKRQVRLALMDIDGFKRFNDTYGHHHGDLILCQLAKVFNEALPGNSHLIRIGGDEFAVLYATEEDERLIRRCLRHLSTDPILLEKSNGEPVYVSVGYAAGGQDSVADLASLYVQADESLYQSKSERAQATFYDEPTLTSFHVTDSVGAPR